MKTAKTEYSEEMRMIRLWQMVILQQLYDALSVSNKPEDQWYKFEARRWLQGKNKDFMAVCDHAGMDPSYIREKANQAIGMGRRFRTERGKAHNYIQKKQYRLQREERLELKGLLAKMTALSTNGILELIH